MAFQSAARDLLANADEYAQVGEFVYRKLVNVAGHGAPPCGPVAVSS